MKKQRTAQEIDILIAKKEHEIDLLKIEKAYLPPPPRRYVGFNVGNKDIE